ncbi:hypothetical protein H4R33_002076 [Dimargaris cristalligena]|nr:hypothetical protein H4R33_002076 [Dimargaris cristalligena]
MSECPFGYDQSLVPALASPPKTAGPNLSVCPFTIDELKLFHEFERYPWSTDAGFQAGLNSVAGRMASPSAPGEEGPSGTKPCLTPAQLLQLQLHYFGKLGRPIDSVQYALFREFSLPATPPDSVSQASDSGSSSRSDGDPQRTDSTSTPSAATAAEGGRREYSSAQTAAFEQFRNYNFSADAQFQSGFAQILQEFRRQNGWMDAAKMDTQTLKCQLYYYNKMVEPIDIRAYLAWRKKHLNQNKAKQGPKCPFAHTWNNANGLDITPNPSQKDAAGPVREFSLAPEDCDTPWNLAHIKLLNERLEQSLQISEAETSAVTSAIIFAKDWSSAQPPRSAATSASQSAVPPVYEDHVSQLPGATFEAVYDAYRQATRKPVAASLDGTESTADENKVSTSVAAKAFASVRPQYETLLQTLGRLFKLNEQVFSNMTQILFMDGLCHRSTSDLVTTSHFCFGSEHLALSFCPFGDSTFPWIPVSSLYILSRLHCVQPPNPLESSASTPNGIMAGRSPHNGGGGGPAVSPSPTPSSSSSPDVGMATTGMAYLFMFHSHLKLRGPELLQLRYIDCFVPVARMPELKRKLHLVAAGPPGTATNIAIRLAYESERVYPGPSKLDAWRKDIHKYLGPCQTATEVAEKLSQIDRDWARVCYQEITRQSPLLVHIICHALNMARNMTASECERLEYYIATKFSHLPDFFVYLDQKQNATKTDKMQFQHANLESVAPTEVEAFFADFVKDKSIDPLSTTHSPLTHDDTSVDSSPQQVCPFSGAVASPKSPKLGTEVLSSNQSIRRCPFASKRMPPKNQSSSIGDSLG